VLLEQLEQQVLLDTLVALVVLGISKFESFINKLRVYPNNLAILIPLDAGMMALMGAFFGLNL
jgi:hypothetical protein